ncbi:MAG TPA: trypsin-like serine protease [Jatrophihabitans sp.]|uniref:trypsin-like serine protease n=1 Tax=Jatrophihabitans sp. TaxID=1932789 RepID=UPI002EE4A92F
MRSANFPRTRWFRSTLLGGLIAALMTLVCVAPADAKVFSPEDRVQPNTTVFPYRAVVEIWSTDTQDGCTGWMYGPDMVATAAHCLYTSTGWIDFSKVEVWPGRQGATTPYPMCRIKSVGVPPEWTTSRDERFDYAAIKLNCTVGNQTGWFNYGSQTGTLVGYPQRICGYAKDKPIHTQWCSDDQVRASDAYQLFYQNDTYYRTSGAPVLQYNANGTWFVMGIHTYQPNHGTGNHSLYNHGTRITDILEADLYSWRYSA